MGLFFPSLLPTLKTLRILHFTSPLTVPDTEFQAPLYILSGIVESLIFSSQPSPWLFTSFLLMKQANLLSRCNVTLLIQNSEDKQRKRIKQPWHSVPPWLPSWFCQASCNIWCISGQSPWEITGKHHSVKADLCHLKSQTHWTLRNAHFNMSAAHVNVRG